MSHGFASGRIGPNLFDINHHSNLASSPRNRRWFRDRVVPRLRLFSAARSSRKCPICSAEATGSC